MYDKLLYEAYGFTFEADEAFEARLKHAFINNDMQEVHRVLARMRGESSSSYLVDKWDALKALNTRARRGFNTAAAIRFVDDAIEQGFAVIMRRDDPFFTVFDVGPGGGGRAWLYYDERWHVLPMSASDRRAVVASAYDVIKYGRSIGSAPESLHNKVPRFAVIPKSALSSIIRNAGV